MVLSTLKDAADNFQPSGVVRSAQRRLTNHFINPHGEPQRAYMWEWEINGLSSNLQHQNLSFYTKAIQIPERSVERLQSKYLGKTVYYAGDDDTEKSIEATVWDDERLESLRFFDSWINHMNTPRIGASVRKERYTADVKIHLKNSFDLFTVLTVDLKEAFPFTRSVVDLSYESNEVMEYSVSLSFDTMYLNGQKYENISSSELTDESSSILEKAIDGSIGRYV